MKSLGTYLRDLRRTLERLPLERIEQAIAILEEARQNRARVFILGNGGSAATASHFVCDLAKNTRQAGRPDFRVVGLADNVPIFSALANDEGYEQVFAGQLASLVEAGDVVIAISASGNSPNVIAALRVAGQAGATTIGFTGFDGGRLGAMADLNLHVPSDCIEHVEDIHLMLEHMICKSLRERALAEVLLGQAVEAAGGLAAGSEAPALE